MKLYLQTPPTLAGYHIRSLNASEKGGKQRLAIGEKQNQTTLLIRERREEKVHKPSRRPSLWGFIDALRQVRN